MVECKECHHEMKEQEGDFTHLFFNQTITLNHVPFYECEHCGHRFYKSEWQVKQSLQKAWEMKVNQMDYYN